MDNLDTFLNKGFIFVHDEDLLKDIDLNEMYWGEKGEMGIAMAKLNTQHEDKLDAIYKTVGEKYIKPILGSYVSSNSDIVNGLEEETLVWHNDLIEGPNCCCLLYCDDTDEDTGGSIAVRNASTKEVTTEFYPKKGDMLILNHSLRFQHKAEKQKMNIPRRVISMNFYVSVGLTK